MKLVLLFSFAPSVAMIIVKNVFGTALGLATQTSDPAAIMKLIESPGAIAGMAAGVMIIVGLWVVEMILYVLMTISIIKTAAQKNMSLSDAMNASKGLIGPYILLSLLTGLALLGLFILLIIPGIIFMVYWMFSTYILVLENKGPTESMSESKRLVTGDWWLTFGYLVLMAIILIGISFAVGVVLIVPTLLLSIIPLIGPIISESLSALLESFLAPLGIIFMMLFYQSMKSQKAKPQ